MTRETTLWLLLMLLGVGALVGRAAFTSPGMGKEYVRAVPVADGQWIRYDATTYGEYLAAEAEAPGQTEIGMSWPRSTGLWISALFTLAIFSFLFRDNPFYRVAEAIVVGVSAAYWMVVGFWDVLVPNLFARLGPDTIRSVLMPGLAEQDLRYLIPLALGIMLLWRLAPSGAWISRWPLAFIIGTTAGLRMIAFLHGDFLAQIRNSILPLVVFEAGQADVSASLTNLIMVAGVLCCLAYFFFSFEHQGVVGGAARVGIWILMVTFGAAFGYTVMGRIALLAIRLEFLIDDWLWLVDPINRRVAG
jgi:hypothetical protein